jgi:hypothetical protein
MRGISSGQCLGRVTDEAKLKGAAISQRRYYNWRTVRRRATAGPLVERRFELEFNHDLDTSNPYEQSRRSLSWRILFQKYQGFEAIPSATIAALK